MIGGGAAAAALIAAVAFAAGYFVRRRRSNKQPPVLLKVVRVDGGDANSSSGISTAIEMDSSVEATPAGSGTATPLGSPFKPQPGLQPPGVPTLASAQRPSLRSGNFRRPPQAAPPPMRAKAPGSTAAMADVRMSRASAWRWLESQVGYGPQPSEDDLDPTSPQATRSGSARASRAAEAAEAARLRVSKSRSSLGFAPGSGEDEPRIADMRATARGGSFGDGVEGLPPPLASAKEVDPLTRALSMGAARGVLGLPELPDEVSEETTKAAVERARERRRRASERTGELPRKPGFTRSGSSATIDTAGVKARLARTRGGSQAELFPSDAAPSEPAASAPEPEPEPEPEPASSGWWPWSSS